MGSPSATPPIYDSGGPTCVIERIVGGHRHRLLWDAMAAARRRGDHQVLVIAAETDRELSTLLESQDFEQHSVVPARVRS